MKRLLFTCGISALMALAAGSSWAQAKNFEGLSIGVNLNSHATAFDRVAAGVTSTASATDQSASIAGMYSMAMGNRFVLGVGATLGLGSYRAGSIGTTDYTAKEFNSIDIAPGYALSDSTLVYAKVSAANVKSAASGGTNTIDNSGTSYGLGFRVFFTQNTYVQLEYLKHNFPEKRYPTETYSPMKQDQIGIGIGYRF